MPPAAAHGCKHATPDRQAAGVPQTIDPKPPFPLLRVLLLPSGPPAAVRGRRLTLAPRPAPLHARPPLPPLLPSAFALPPAPIGLPLPRAPALHCCTVWNAALGRRSARRACRAAQALSFHSPPLHHSFALTSHSLVIHVQPAPRQPYLAPVMRPFLPQATHAFWTLLSVRTPAVTPCKPATANL